MQNATKPAKPAAAAPAAAPAPAAATPVCPAKFAATKYTLGSRYAPNNPARAAVWATITATLAQHGGTATGAQLFNALVAAGPQGITPAKALAYCTGTNSVGSAPLVKAA